MLIDAVLIDALSFLLMLIDSDWLGRWQTTMWRGHQLSKEENQSFVNYNFKLCWIENGKGRRRSRKRSSGRRSLSRERRPSLLFEVTSTWKNWERKGWKPKKLNWSTHELQPLPGLNGNICVCWAWPRLSCAKQGENLFCQVKTFSICLAISLSTSF